MDFSKHKRAFVIKQYFKIKSIVERQEALTTKFRNSKGPNRAYIHVGHSACVYTCIEPFLCMRV